MKDIYQKFKEFTLHSESTYLANLELVKKFATERSAIVECGIWKGGMLMGIRELLPNNPLTGYDSFEGLPEPQMIDGKAALDYAANKEDETYFDNCKVSLEDVQDNLKKVGMEGKVRLVKGFFSPLTFALAPTLNISVLILDCDWYESINQCLHHLYHYVIPGGIVIVDDYVNYDGAARAVNNFVSVERIREFNGVTYFQKPILKED